MKPDAVGLEERISRYEANLRKAFSEISRATRELGAQPREIIDLAFSYAEDAKYFKEKGDLTTALISLSYAEGLLDALRIMGVVEFTWTDKQVRQHE